MRYTLRKQEILRGNAFQEVFRKGKKIEGNILWCIVLMKKELAKNPRQRIQAGFAVRGSVVRRAVDRNRVRRLMREAYRLHKQVLSDLQHTDNQLRMIFLFSPNEKEFILPDYPTIEEDIKLFLHTIHSMLSS